MKLWLKHGLVVVLFFSLMSSCSHKTKPVSSGTGNTNLPGPPCIVYKMHSDYSQFIPVILSEDKTTIVSYPGIKDIYYKEKLSYPTPLTGDYFLDNRGINQNVAFLNITYDDYSKLPSTPSAGELMKRILDKDPIAEMYQCGLRSQYSDIENELNAIIVSGRLKEFKRLK
jgi:hypothetical protein